MGAASQSGVWSDIFRVSCIRQFAVCPPGIYLSLLRRMLRGRCQKRRVSIRACLKCCAHGCPCSVVCLWDGRWNLTRSILGFVASSLYLLDLIAQSQVGPCPGWFFLASGRHTATLQSSVHKLMIQTHSYCTPSRPCRKEGLVGDGPCRDEELLAPILRLIFVSLPFVLLLSGLQRILCVRSSSPWQKPALKDRDYNKSCAVKCLNSSPHSLLSSSRHA